MSPGSAEERSSVAGPNAEADRLHREDQRTASSYIFGAIWRLPSGKGTMKGRS